MFLKYISCFYLNNLLKIFYMDKRILKIDRKFVKIYVFVILFFRYFVFYYIIGFIAFMI